MRSIYNNSLELEKIIVILCERLRGVIGHRHHFMRDRIQGTEDIKSLSPRGGIDKESLKAPEEAEKRLQDNMRCIDEIHLLATLLGVR